MDYLVWCGESRVLAHKRYRKRSSQMIFKNPQKTNKQTKKKSKNYAIAAIKPCNSLYVHVGFSCD